MERIKDIWAKFQWDENKSFVDNLRALGGILKDGIVEWWKDPDNPIKGFYDEHIAPIIEKISEIVAPIIEKVKEVWNSIKEKAGNFTIKLPIVGEFRPFGFLLGKPSTESGAVGRVLRGMATGVDES